MIGQNQIELLAPAGDWDSFIAAVTNGANAVYLGGKLFSARKSARNFELDEIKEACEYAHLWGAKVFVTANTLLDDSEMAEALAFLTKLYNIGVDAVIVQDVGLMYLASSLIPELPLHASTQMAVINSFGAEFLKELGLKRVVLARELSLENIELIHRQLPDLELEVFCHGALCVSYSGQCLMSSLIGGRSGNRGACAQPCRLTYKLVDQKGNQVAVTEVGEHLLSPKDLFTLDLVPELVAAGTKSLKIEGRMKRPEYVATVVANYAKALDRLFRAGRDNYQVLPQEESELKQVFNRDFTRAFLSENPGSDYISYKRSNNRGLLLGRVQLFDKKTQQAHIKLDIPLTVGDGIEIWVSKGGRVATTVGRIHLGKEMVEEAFPGQSVSIDLPKWVNQGDRVFKTHDQKLITKAQATFKQAHKKIPVNIKATVALNRPLELEMQDDQGNKVLVTSDFIGEKAEKRPINEEVLNNQLERLGNTSFMMEKAEYLIESDVMMPMSVINQTRRKAVEELTAKRLQKYHRKKLDVGIVVNNLNQMNQGKSVEKKAKQYVNQPELTVVVGSMPALQAAIKSGADTVYLGGEKFRSGQSFSASELAAGIKACKEHHVKAILAIPRIIHDNQLEIGLKEVLKAAEKAVPDGILTGNIGGVKLAGKYFKEQMIYGDFYLNIFNSSSAKFYADYQVKRITLSPELTLKQLQIITANVNNIELELLVHGSLLMMTSEYCPVGSLVGGRKTGVPCSLPCIGKRFGLKDRMNFVFPVEQDELCRSYIYNPKKLCMIDHMRDLAALKTASWRLELRGAGPKEVEQTVSIYKQEMGLFFADPKGYNDTDGELAKSELTNLNPGGFTKGHYFRGVLES